jgi:flagellar secretion chaperone FliS
MMEPHLSTYASNFKLAAYQSVSVHGGVANADPHAMVLMLMDAAAERIATARGCIERGETARQAKLLHSCVNILAELSGSLNMVEGGNLAKNLGDLYDYMIRTLLLANTQSDGAGIANVSRLMEEIRSAWVAIGPQVRNAALASVPAPANTVAGQP